MKKIFWVIGLIVVGILAYVAVYNFQNYGKRAKTSEVVTLAQNLKQMLDLHKVRKGTYPGAETLIIKENVSHWYKWGVGSPVKEYCNDCMITPDSYKIVIYGNIDDDPAMDVWVMESPDGSLFQISDDVAK